MKTKLILEIGCNHQGDVKIAERMIDEAARLEVWGVKFQKRDIESITDDVKCKPRAPHNSFGSTYYEHRKALEIHADELGRLAIRAMKLGLEPGVSVFDMNSLREMAKLSWRFIKLPSQLYPDAEMNCQLLVATEATEKISMVSTGMHTLAELEAVEHFGMADVTMYCRSIYPCPGSKVKLHLLKDMADKLDGLSAIGYSSHDINGVVIPWAVALGAEYVERHFTLDKTMKGNDHGTVSSDIPEMQKIIRSIKYVEDIMNGEDELDADELKVRKVYRGY